MQLNDWIYLDFAESKRREIMRTYDYFYYIKGRFPANDNLITLPKPKIPDIVQDDNAISPISLYEQFREGKFHALLYTQFLLVPNIHLGGSSKLSRDATSECYHNLSMQALSKLNYNALLNFYKISDFVMNINYLL